MSARIARLAATAAAVAATALAAAAGPALAAPDHTAELTTAKPAFAWDGGPGFGTFATSDVTSRLGCDAPGYDCETVLVKTTELGSLDVELSDFGPTTGDVDLHVYYSDAEGTQGDLAAESVKFNPQDGAGESASTGEVDPGYYLVLVDYYLAAGGSYKGKATFTPSPTT